MSRYRYSCTTSVLWASFDYGEVEADSYEEAKAEAINKLKYDMEKANGVLSQADCTQGFSIEFNFDEIVIKKI